MTESSTVCVPIGDWNGDYTWERSYITVPNTNFPQTGWANQQKWTYQVPAPNSVPVPSTFWPPASLAALSFGWQTTTLPNLLMLSFSLQKMDDIDDFRVIIQGNVLNLINLKEKREVAMHFLENGYDLENIVSKFQYGTIIVMVPKYAEVQRTISIKR